MGWKGMIQIFLNIDLFCLQHQFYLKLCYIISNICRWFPRGSRRLTFDKWQGSCYCAVLIDIMMKFSKFFNSEVIFLKLSRTLHQFIWELGFFKHFEKMKIPTPHCITNSNPEAEKWCYFLKFIHFIDLTANLICLQLSSHHIIFSSFQQTCQTLKSDLFPGEYGLPQIIYIQIQKIC